MAIFGRSKSAKATDGAAGASSLSSLGPNTSPEELAERLDMDIDSAKELKEWHGQFLSQHGRQPSDTEFENQVSNLQKLSELAQEGEQQGQTSAMTLMTMYDKYVQSVVGTITSAQQTGSIKPAMIPQSEKIVHSSEAAAESISQMRRDLKASGKAAAGAPMAAVHSAIDGLAREYESFAGDAGLDDLRSYWQTTNKNPGIIELRKDLELAAGSLVDTNKIPLTNQGFVERTEDGSVAVSLRRDSGQSVGATTQQRQEDLTTAPVFISETMPGVNGQENVVALGQLLNTYDQYLLAVTDSISGELQGASEDWTSKAGLVLATAQSTREELASYEQRLAENTGIHAGEVARLNQSIDEIRSDYNELNISGAASAPDDLWEDEVSGVLVLRQQVFAGLETSAENPQAEHQLIGGSFALEAMQTSAGMDPPADSSATENLVSNNNQGSSRNYHRSIALSENSASSGSSNTSGQSNRSEQVAAPAARPGSVADFYTLESNALAASQLPADVATRSEAIKRDLGPQYARQFDQWYRGQVAAGNTPTRGQIDFAIGQLESQAAGGYNGFNAIDQATNPMLSGALRQVADTTASASTLRNRSEAILRDYGREAQQEFQSWLEQNPGATIGRMDAETGRIIEGRTFLPDQVRNRNSATLEVNTMANRPTGPDSATSAYIQASHQQQVAAEQQRNRDTAIIGGGTFDDQQRMRANLANAADSNTATATQNVPYGSLFPPNIWGSQEVWGELDRILDGAESWPVQQRIENGFENWIQEQTANGGTVTEQEALDYLKSLKNTPSGFAQVDRPLVASSGPDSATSAYIQASHQQAAGVASTAKQQSAPAIRTGNVDINDLSIAQLRQLSSLQNQVEAGQITQSEAVQSSGYLYNPTRDYEAIIAQRTAGSNVRPSEAGAMSGQQSSSYHLTQEQAQALQDAGYRGMSGGSYQTAATPSSPISPGIAFQNSEAQANEASQRQRNQNYALSPETIQALQDAGYRGMSGGSYPTAQAQSGVPAGSGSPMTVMGIEANPAQADAIRSMFTNPDLTDAQRASLGQNLGEYANTSGSIPSAGTINSWVNEAIERGNMTVAERSIALMQANAANASASGGPTRSSGPDSATSAYIQASHPPTTGTSSAASAYIQSLYPQNTVRPAITQTANDADTLAAMANASALPQYNPDTMSEATQQGYRDIAEAYNININSVDDYDRWVANFIATNKRQPSVAEQEDELSRIRARDAASIAGFRTAQLRGLDGVDSGAGLNRTPAIDSSQAGEVAQTLFAAGENLAPVAKRVFSAAQAANGSNAASPSRLSAAEFRALERSGAATVLPQYAPASAEEALGIIEGARNDPNMSDAQFAALIRKFENHLTANNEQFPSSNMLNAWVIDVKSNVSTFEQPSMGVGGVQGFGHGQGVNIANYVRDEIRKGVDEGRESKGKEKRLGSASLADKYDQEVAEFTIRKRRPPTARERSELMARVVRTVPMSLAAAVSTASGGISSSAQVTQAGYGAGSTGVGSAPGITSAGLGAPSLAAGALARTNTTSAGAVISPSLKSSGSPAASIAQGVSRGVTDATVLHIPKQAASGGAAYGAAGVRQAVSASAGVVPSQAAPRQSAGSNSVASVNSAKTTTATSYKKASTAAVPDAVVAGVRAPAAAVAGVANTVSTAGGGARAAATSLESASVATRSVANVMAGVVASSTAATALANTASSFASGKAAPPTASNLVNPAAAPTRTAPVVSSPTVKSVASVKAPAASSSAGTKASSAKQTASSSYASSKKTVNNKLNAAKVTTSYTPPKAVSKSQASAIANPSTSKKGSTTRTSGGSGMMRAL